MTFSFAPKLGTNYCPEDGEIAQIRTLLVEPTLRLERLGGEIADMQKAIDKLKEERDALVAYVEAHKALISPVRRNIRGCLPTHRNCVMSAREAPVLLGRICSSWRMISLSTPRLWARLHIVEPSRSYAPTTPSVEEKFAQRLETTKTWLGRSGHCPLTISLEGGVDVPRNLNPSSDSRIFVEALIPLAHRWRHIEFTVTSAALEPLFQLTEANVPMLKSVRLYQCSGREGDSNLNWKLFGMLRGRQISSFSITGRNFTFPELPLQWNRLTALSMLRSPSVPSSLAAITSETALHIISRCSELRECKLGVVDDRPAEMEAPRPIEHPFIHTFELSTGTTVTFKLLLGHLSLPNLRDFTFRVTWHPSFNNPPTETGIDIQALGAFLASSVHFESLGMETNELSNHPCLRFPLPWGVPADTPSTLDDDVLALLAPTLAVTDCCPALQELHIYNPRTLSDAALLRLIMSRTAGGPRTKLKRVTVLFPREMQDDILPDLQPLIKRGLNVTIKHLPPMSPPDYSPWVGLADAPTERWLSSKNFWTITS
ncbi:hypothetical protein DFH09DRAFT_1283183 [Mycena vulgaris]|nr:hypothetical protein DFH09DRAFT_1283183 [Mycena vulgaris]